MINKHLRIVRQLHARRARPAPPVHVFGDGYPCKRADPREIALPEGEVSGAGKMLLRDVQLLAIAEHRLICLNLSEAARTLPCDLDIAAMDGAKPPCRKRIRRGFDPAAVGAAIGRSEEPTSELQSLMRT